MSKTLRYYISKEKRVKQYPRVKTPRYQKDGHKNSDNYREGKKQNDI